MSKVKIRLMSTSKSDVEKLRSHFLKSHPQAILGHPRSGLGNQWNSGKWFVYGDYEFNKVRRRHGE